MRLSASNFEGKTSAFVTSLNKMVASNNKIPVWFKPFLDLVKDFVSDISLTFTQLEGSLAVQKAVTDALDNDRQKLFHNLIKVEDTLEDQLQYTRRNQILVHGLPEKEGRENTDDAVLEVFKEMDVNITKNEINRSHRLGKRKNSQGSDKQRPVIVSFVSYRS